MFQVLKDVSLLSISFCSDWYSEVPRDWFEAQVSPAVRRRPYVMCDRNARYDGQNTAFYHPGNVQDVYHTTYGHTSVRIPFQ